ncbi:hypothetical protein EZV62_014662 [Acer yangbiense]|uniref:Very-long-chain (3R)-3-hydroxyacyl-CoA dehydratase n=1 Tax=Acer yangbiense TaxID=1000413 RepID=A0A5C7HTN3_9ROSI|nr:hypothetical protein EZV62_014662 [Acer yangbiense]
MESVTIMEQLAAEAVKEAERVSKMAEDTEAVLQLVEDIREQCLHGEVVILAGLSSQLSQVLYLALKTLNESGHEHVYNAVQKPLILAQSAAVLEILHGLVGLVRSPITSTLPQISSRLYVTWGILWSFPQIQTHILVSSLVISWSVTEIIRYSFFGMKEAFGFTPSWFLWLRYSTFLLLYPTGITSEVGLIFYALPYIKESDKYCIRMPNKWNFSFDYLYAAILVLGFYVPGSPHLYGYMLRQRKKALSKSKRE